jgi:hypothetical protein
MTYEARVGTSICESALRTSSSKIAIGRLGAMLDWLKTRVAQMSDTLPIDLNSAALRLGGHVSGMADRFNGHIDESRTAHVPRSDGWIATTWNNMSTPGAFAVAAAEEQAGGELPPLAGAGVVVCLMG